MKASNEAGKPGLIRRSLRTPAKLKQFIKTHIADQALRAITWVLGVFSVAIGIALVITTPAAEEAPPFSLNFDFAPPHVWGGLFAFLGIWIIISLVGNSKPKLPCYFIGMLAGIWAMFTIADILSGKVPATSFIAYTTLSAVAFICGVAFEDFDDFDEEITQ